MTQTTFPQTPARIDGIWGSLGENSRNQLVSYATAETFQPLRSDFPRSANPFTRVIEKTKLLEAEPGRVYAMMPAYLSCWICGPVLVREFVAKSLSNTSKNLLRPHWATISKYKQDCSSESLIHYPRESRFRGTWSGCDRTGWYLVRNFIIIAMSQQFPNNILNRIYEWLGFTLQFFEQLLTYLDVRSHAYPPPHTVTKLSI